MRLKNWLAMAINNVHNSDIKGFSTLSMVLAIAINRPTISTTASKHDSAGFVVVQN